MASSLLLYTTFTLHADHAPQFKKLPQNTIIINTTPIRLKPPLDPPQRLLKTTLPAAATGSYHSNDPRLSDTPHETLMTYVPQLC